MRAPRTELGVLPAPQSVRRLDRRRVALPDTVRCAPGDPALADLIAVVDGELRMLTGRRVIADSSGTCRLSIDTTLAREGYRLRTGETIEIAGGSYDAVAMGTVTLLQMLYDDGERWLLPAVEIEDAPESSYRGLLIDVARKWHDVEMLEQLVILARWYKLNYVQLHLTDDQSFTFPTESYPRLPTPGRHYTKAQLRALVEFARVRGVAIVPEIEVPGHAGQMTARMPQTFAIARRDSNPGTINMGREQAYRALDRIIREIAQLFTTSPYIHIGGDEASLDHLADDPQVTRYLRAKKLENVTELYRHFLVRMHEIVQKHGKRTVVWEGFAREGTVEIPRDILVMAWETIYQLPQDLLAGGYTIVNASWKPLYVVNQRKWDPAVIYRWNLYRWENWIPRMPSFTPIQLEPSSMIVGASMSSWDQPQHVTLHSLRPRVPAMSERIWHRDSVAERSFDWFRATYALADSALQRVLSPVSIRTEGLTYPELEDGHFNEHRWFGDSVAIMLAADSGQVIRFTLDGTPVTATSPTYVIPLRLWKTSPLRVRAFTESGEPIGYERWERYELRPIRAEVTGTFSTPLSEAWERPDEAAVFLDSVTIALSGTRSGFLRYTLNGQPPTAGSPPFRQPLVITEATTVYAQLFDRFNREVGEPWIGRFVPAER